MRALIVDDCVELRHLLSILLIIEGYNVETASNGLEALEIIKNQKISFDLLLTDFNMPYMTGKQLIEEILKFKFDIKKIVVLSGTHLNETNLHSILESNSNIRFLNKMTSTKNILNFIQQ